MHERCLPHKLAIPFNFVSSKNNGHVTPITGRRRLLPGVNLMSPPCIVPPRIECLVSSPAHITRVNHDWLLKPGVTRAGRGARAARRAPA